MFIKKLFYTAVLTCSVFLVPSVTSAQTITSTLAPQIPLRGDFDTVSFDQVLYHWGTGDKFEVETDAVKGSEPYLDSATMRLHGNVWTEGFGWFSFDFGGATVELVPATPGDTDLFDIQGQAWGPNFGYITFDGLVQYDRLLNDAAYPDEGVGKFVGSAWSENVGFLPMDEVFLDISAYEVGDITFVPDTLTFGAQLAKEIRITTVDDGADIIDADFSIRNINDDGFVDYNGVVYTPGVGLEVTHDFPDVDLFGSAGSRDYPATITITDRSGNTTELELDFTVVAGDPFFAPGSSTVSLDNDGDPKIAINGVDGTYTFDAHFEDEFGNIIRDVAGVKTVAVEFDFNNTVNTNQFLAAVLGNAVTYNSSTYGVIDQTGPNNNVVLEGLGIVGLDGNYDLEVHSIAPTASGYPPSAGANLSFARAELVVIPDVGQTGVGDGNFDLTPEMPSTNFAYAPAITNEIEVPAGFVQFTEGVETLLDINFITDAIGAQLIDKVEHEIVFAPDDPLFEYSLIAEKADPGDPDPAIGIDTYSFSSNNHSHHAELNEGIGEVSAFYNIMPNNFTAGYTDTRQQKVVPTTLLGGTGSTLVDVASRMAYRHNSRVIAYPGAGIDDLDTVATTIEIIGKVRTDFFGLTGQAVNNIGDIGFDTVRTSMRRNVSDLVKGSTVPENQNINGWPTTGVHALRDGSVLFYKGDTQWSGAGGITVPPGRHTLVVFDGHLKILSNITYADETSSLGVVVMSSNPGDIYNIYIDPSVQEIVGGYYVEGSVLSLNGAGFDHYDGFNTVPGALTTPIRIQGSLHSYNTLGGSRLDPPELPTLVEIPVEYRGSSEEQRKAQQLYGIGYDLMFLRRGDGVTTAVTIEYDPRIQTSTPLGFEVFEGGEATEVVR